MNSECSGDIVVQQHAAWLRAVDCELSQNHPDRLPKEISLRSYAAEVLLDLHNETWNDDAEIDCKTFVGMMLEAIAFYSDASAQLYYNDGDLFWGHPIVVSINADASFEDAQIAG